MCGISGFNLAPKDIGVIDASALARTLLLEIETRGRDATGAAWYEGDTLIVQKDAMKARDFVHFLDIPQEASNVILHTRFGTKGSEKDNNNNHPIITGNVVGVHNGGVWNDDTLFRIMDLEDERIAEVDTEAIFAAIAYGQEVHPKKGGPRLSSDLLGILSRIDGSAAIAWQEIEGDNKQLHVARIYNSPLAWGHTENGSFIFASTKWHLSSACKELGIELDTIIEPDEGVYMRINSGRVDDYQKFEVWPVKNKKVWTNTYGGTTSVKKPVGKGSGVVTQGPKKQEKEDKSVATAAAENPSATATIRAAIESFNKTIEDQGEFLPFLSAVVLSAHLGLLFNSEPIETPDGDDYYEQYTQREDAIENFMKELTDHDEDSAVQTVMELRGFIRPGDWVTTDLGQLNGLIGQVWLLPQQFPYGNYVIRVMVPNSRYEGGYEPVLVERKLDEFDVISLGPTAEQEAEVEDTSASNVIDQIIEDVKNEQDDEVN